MKAKKTIWISIMIGVISAVINILVSEAHFAIPLGNSAFIGVVEISNTLSASLGGPIALIITIVVTIFSHFMLNIELYSDMQFTLLAIADALIHIVALLVVAISYYRFLYPRLNKTGLFLVGWWLTVGVYYYVGLLPLQSVLINYADPSFGATYPSFARIFFPEFLGTSMITTLIWFALPVHYRRSMWVKDKESEKAGAVQEI